MSLTKTQEDILKFIKESCESSGPPSYREIQRHFRYKSVNAVQDHVRALREKGVLEKNKNGRGLQPLGYRAAKFKRIPIYGEIAAGAPQEASQIELGAVMVEQKVAKGDCFALRVRGDSMIEAGIFEGDLLIVQRNLPIRDEDIVVALVDGENTVKRYRKKGDDIFLIPENPRMHPINVTNKSLQIQGRVVALQRNFTGV